MNAQAAPQGIAAPLFFLYRTIAETGIQLPGLPAGNRGCRGSLQERAAKNMGPVSLNQRLFVERTVSHSVLCGGWYIPGLEFRRAKCRLKKAENHGIILYAKYRANAALYYTAGRDRS